MFSNNENYNIINVSLNIQLSYLNLNTYNLIIHDNSIKYTNQTNYFNLLLIY